jgi:hypothetical protein
MKEQKLLLTTENPNSTPIKNPKPVKYATRQQQLTTSSLSKPVAIPSAKIV